MCPFLMLCIRLLFLLTYTNLDRLQHISFVIYLLKRFNLVIVLLVYIILPYSMIGLMKDSSFFSLAFCSIEKEVSAKDQQICLQS